MKRYRVAVTEDRDDFRQWLCEEVAETTMFDCVADYGFAREAVASILKIKPDFVLMDLHLEGSAFGGIECMLRIRQVAPDIRFLVITDHADDERLFEALKAGAEAYILKHDIPDKLEAVLTEFAAGGAPMSPQIAMKVIQSFHRPPQETADLQKLTARETEILDLIAKGFFNKEIKDKLNIAENTVKATTYRIYKKLQVNNRVEAVRKYMNLH